MNRTARVALPEADTAFLRTFMPYEIRLAQRRAMLWERDPDALHSSVFLGVFVLRLDQPLGFTIPRGAETAAQMARHVRGLIQQVIRDSDIPVFLRDGEHLALLRDLDPDQAYVVAQRMLTLAGSSDLIRATSLIPRVGYVVYPLSSRPDLEPNRWEILLSLARRMCDRSETGGPASGFGLFPGPSAAESRIPESDLIPLVFEDAASLVKAGAIQMQRIHVLPKP
jgi:hypothetical protein